MFWGFNACLATKLAPAFTVTFNSVKVSASSHFPYRVMSPVTRSLSNDHLRVSVVVTPSFSTSAS